MNMNYFITTEHIGFRIWDENDLHLAKLLWGDSEVTRYIGGPFSNEQIKARFLKEISNYGLYEFQYWPIFLMNNDIFLGCCG
ncbi:MAG TPA: GNAT family N-acetyltransferase, partial [Firmicutes bacterium]|nr:GNAT family N-acetyltransferase [Bacillota bacterium]